ncbi:MAG TPA: imidazoleglycerol-phosphate dehydratase, partial [Actinobacteria bacterium]|nr:imidazoleglycerol-phosphate dehydratase [Actinomycetota bacterium]
MARTATVERQTRETQIRVTLNLDGRGESEIASPVPFFDHMLTQIARHGFFDLKIAAEGDIEIDAHHTVEDLGICLGEAFRKALGGKEGIRRYGRGTMPMHEALASV